MKEVGKILFFVIAALAAVLPIAKLYNPAFLPWLNAETIILLNLIGWFLVLFAIAHRERLNRYLSRVARNLGIDARFKSLERLFENVLHEVDRKNSSLSIGLIERKITSKDELSRALERIVSMAFKLFDAESAELALFDKETGLYHSSFVLGKPFRTSAQAMLSGAVEGRDHQTSPDVLVHPISFAGYVLGSLRVALKKGTLPATGDQDIMRLLALQGSFAISNAQYTEELVRMKRVSEESVKAKTGFLANLSHEIRGPLGIILNAVELVLDGLCGPVNNDQLETLKMVRSNGEHLLELINDVLDYAKVESGKIVPEKVDILVNELLQDISGTVRAQAEAKSHRLIYKPNDEVLTISADRRHIRQMLINMLTNAIKYTPDGGTIEFWAERIPGSKIKINVKDSGVGIEETERSKVFAAFERVNNAYSIAQVGTGLGMPLTKRLAEVNGGAIDFLSEPGKGSHFWLKFPAIEYAPPLIKDQTTTTTHEEVVGHGEEILLVEKEEGERNMLTRYLAHIGYKIVAASTRIEAVEVLRERKIDLAIIDNNVLDNTDGDVLQGIRENAKSSHLPIILVSSRAFVFDIEKYLKSGADRCLSKPLDLKELGKICRELITGRSTNPADQGSSKDDKKTSTMRNRVLGADDVFH